MRKVSLSERRKIALQRAKEANGDLYDPIEDDPAVKQLIDDIQKQVIDESKEKQGIGFCHYIWVRTQEILKKKYGIVWYSPAEMNPDVDFD